MKNTNWIEPENITDAHAWRRWLARNFDLVLFIYILSVIVLVIAYLLEKYATRSIPSAYGPSGVNASVDKDETSSILFTSFCIVPLLILVVHLLKSICNAILMACLGNTFGKQLFGIKILHATGRSINFKEAFKREMLVCKKKLFVLCIPFIGPLIIGLPISVLYIDYRAYKNLRENKITSWDKQMNLKVSYRTQSVWITLVGVIMLIGLYTGFEMVLEMCKNWENLAS